MYAYVDESGNTGNQLFDAEQPLFLTAAMMTKTNFDAVHKRALSLMARRLGMPELHAKDLGIAGVEEVADDLLRVVKQADAKFFIARVEKLYVAATKVFDTYFDAGENLSVPWHTYWVRHLRLLLTFKLAHYVLTEDIAKTVWECLTTKNAVQSRTCFLRAAEAMLTRADNLPDARSRQVVGDALRWALENPENFDTHIRNKVNRNMHSPNFVGFSLLAHGIEKASKSWGRSVREIVHDRQQEFEKTLQVYHEMFSRPDLADAEPFRLPGDSEAMPLCVAPGSRFRMVDSSPGLQVVDVVLWLFKRVVSGDEIGPRGARLLNRVFLRGYQNDLSFGGVGGSLEEQMSEIMSAQISEEQMQEGARLMAKSEENRIAAMRDYVAQKAAATAPA